MPKPLTTEQKQQVLKDLIDLRHAKVKAEALGMIPGYAKPLVDSGMRLLDTLAIAAGCFEVEPADKKGVNHG